MKEKIDVYQIITDRIIAMLEAGTVPWQKPWAGAFCIPKNLVSGKEYRGLNVFILAASGFESPYWLTYKQCAGLGGQVRKGEKATPVVFWKWLEVDDPASADGRKRIPLLRYYSVFNVAQCDDLPADKIPAAPAKGRKHTPSEEAETIVAAMPQKPDVRHGKGGAYYSPTEDYVGMPSPESFKASEYYYGTLFHELTHSTGHASRLDRKAVTDPIFFGTEKYAGEELVAEMGAAFLCGHVGIVDRVVDNSAGYIAHWLSKLRDDRKLVVQAAAQAQKAVDFILGNKFETETTTTTEEKE